jgi:hypothetical protein
MTQRDEHSENGAVHESVGDEVQAPNPDDVTRQQSGQFSVESAEVAQPPADALEAQADARLDRSATETINALQVTMDRSGAEHIHAQRVAMTSAGAKSIEAKSAKLNQSAAITISTEKADLRQSSSLVVSADEVTLERSSTFIAAASKATLGNGNRIGMLTVGDLKANGNVRAFMLMSGNVEAGGNVQTALTGPTAVALGAGFAAIWFVLRRLFGSGGN